MSIIQKTAYILLLILVTLPHVVGANLISLEEFKKLDPSQRENAIKQASPEQKEELERIDLHLRLLARWGGEAELKMARETQVAKARGLGALEGIFDTQAQLWDQYIGGVLMANDKAGMPSNKQAEAELRLTHDRDFIVSRITNIHSLVFNMVASPAALDLVKKVEKLDGKLREKFHLGESTPEQRITKTQLDEVDKQIDQVVEEMKKLPKLTSDQAQKEYDAFTEDKIRPW